MVRTLYRSHKDLRGVDLVKYPYLSNIHTSKRPARRESAEIRISISPRFANRGLRENRASHSSRSARRGLRQIQVFTSLQHIFHSPSSASCSASPRLIYLPTLLQLFFLFHHPTSTPDIHHVSIPLPPPPLELLFLIYIFHYRPKLSSKTTPQPCLSSGTQPRTRSS